MKFWKPLPVLGEYQDDRVKCGNMFLLYTHAADIHICMLPSPEVSKSAHTCDPVGTNTSCEISTISCEISSSCYEISSSCCEISTKTATTAEKTPYVEDTPLPRFLCAHLTLPALIFYIFQERTLIQCSTTGVATRTSV